MPRTVLLPTDIKDKLLQLTQLENETRVLLLYQKFENTCVVVTYFVVGGNESPGFVNRNEGLTKIILNFLAENPEYRVIDAHTHTVATGEHWATRFSQQDLNNFRKTVAKNSEYMGALITPTNILLWAPDNPKLELCKPHPKFVHEKLYERIKECARRKGLSLSTEFRLGKVATRRETRRPTEIHKKPK